MRIICTKQTKIFNLMIINLIFMIENLIIHFDIFYVLYIQYNICLLFSTKNQLLARNWSRSHSKSQLSTSH